MRRVFGLAVLPILGLLVACGSAQPIVDVKPVTASTVLAMSADFDFTFMPGEDIEDVEWDIEIEYDTRDVQAVYDYYHAELVALGFTRTSFDPGGEEIEAEYENAAGLEIDIEVEIDDGRVEVDLDIDDFTPPFPAGFSLTSFAGFGLPIYPGAEVKDVEWDFNFDHPNTARADVFDYYDQHLQDLGWTQTEFDDGDDDDMEAEYVRDGVHLELEVEDNSEVELEFNKLRFY